MEKSLGEGLVGRNQERARLGALLEAARRGRGGALVLRGEPGSGKSALLRDALTHAGGLSGLAACGVEPEWKLPFAGLARLLRPLLPLLGALPSPQAKALAGALALAPPAAADRFPLDAGTLTLLVAGAESAPLLVVVDDAQWLDPASRDALLFAGRRLEGEPVALLLAVSPGEGDSDAFEHAGLDVLELGPLDLVAAHALLMRRAPGVGRDVADRLVGAAAGNAGALLEVLDQLGDAQLGGTEPLDEPLPAPLAAERVTLRRLAELAPESRRALLVAAAHGSGEMDSIARAAEFLALDVGLIEEAESACLVSIDDGALRFRSEVTRSAVYYAASPAERRAAHRALAAAFDAPRFTARRAPHLAAAALRPDEGVARPLEAAARSASRIGSHAAAASAFAQAGHLTPDEAARSRRLLEAAREARLAGGGKRAAAFLEEAATSAAEPGLRSEIDRLRRSLAKSPRARARRPLTDSIPQLTPQELQVALLVARGARNREAAVELCVSPKTIEYHLRNIYTKLEIRSRTDLTRVLAERGALAATGSPRN